MNHPPGWLKARLGDVADIRSGYGFPKALQGRSEGDYPFAKVRDISATVKAGELVLEGAVHWVDAADLVKLKARLLPAGATLLAKIGEAIRLNRRVIAGRDLLVDNNVFAVIPYGADELFLLFFMKTLDLYPLSIATAVPSIRKSDLAEVEMPIPPLNEQRRIAVKVDALLARSRRAKEALDAVPPLLEQFRQSVLAAAFRGDLTADWRAQNPDVEPADQLLERIRAERRRRWEKDYLAKQKAKGKTPKNDKWKSKYKEPDEPEFLNGQHSLPAGWTWTSVSCVTECLDSHRVPVTRKNRAPGPFPYYGANGQVDLIDQWLFDEPLVLVTEDETFYGRTKPIAYRVTGKCWVNNHAHVLRPLAPLDTRFIHFSLMHYPVWPWLTGTTGRAKLTQGALNRLPLAVPPLAELKVLVPRIESALALSNVLPEVEAGVGRLADLNRALLAQAFRGELVPQDPNDEPASVLLERIRAEREAAAPKKMRKDRGRAKDEAKS